MLPKADSGSFVLFSLLFVLTVTDPPRTGKFDFIKKRIKKKMLVLLLLRVLVFLWPLL